MNTDFMFEYNLAALSLIASYGGTTPTDKYRTLCQRFFNGGSAILLFFTLYHVWQMERKGKYIPIESFRCEKYDEFLKYIFDTYGVDFTNVKVDTVRVDYKKLYLYPDLHHYAEQGLIKHDYIRRWEQMAFLIDDENPPTTREDMERLFDQTCGTVTQDTAITEFFIISSGN